MRHWLLQGRCGKFLEADRQKENRMTNELELRKKQELSEQRSLGTLTNQLTLADHLVYKKYLAELQNYGMVELSQKMLEVQDPAQCIRMFQLKELTLKKGEDMFQKLSTVYYSSMAQGCSLAVMIDVPEENAGANIYLGVREDPSRKNMKKRNLDTSSKTLQKVLLSNFPGSDIKGLSPAKKGEGEQLLNDAFGENQGAVASVSCVAALRDKSKTEDKAFIQGIERFMDAMEGETYTALFLAEPVSNETQAAIRSGYENLYSSLSPFRKSTWSYTENESTSVMESLCAGTSHTISNTISTTTTDGTNQSSSVSDGTQKTRSITGGINGGIGTSSGKSVSSILPIASGMAGILGLGGIAATMIPGVGGVVGPLLGLTGKVAMVASPTTSTFSSVARNIGGSLGLSASWGTSHTTAEQMGTSHSMSNGTSYGVSDSTSQQETHGTTDTRGIGRSQQIELCNKSVEELLERIESQLKRVKESEDYGCYNCAAYFLSSVPSTAILAANTYRALMVGEGSSVESGAVNVWQRPDQVKQLREYLKRFMHPMFARQLWNDSPESLIYTPATLVSGQELPIHLGLPTRSVHGLAVIEHAEFGRNVPNASAEYADEINLGKIYHMGKSEPAALILNRQALTAHTFITGSTGSGKSNTVYELLRQLDAGGVNFMVIEPAKGEYKNVFGDREDVHVFGTNPKITKLLHINPFRFPEEIHVLEHIDRLIEIFSVCWPMYAAMPAVLKNAMLQAYEVCGWNLDTSENEYNKNLFPTFQDLLTELVDVIEHSAYDKEVKNNYRGSLETRVRSLANGLNGQIFSADEIPEKQLFDENTIVDLSRVGSLESKSLIMGILIMRLNEYRMTSCTEMNNPLKHVTVLEEAHNILRRTSTEQTEEGSNVAGKSVEMIANAIAEMRTYGEGFVIADQSPGAVDISAIRNTNTKIIMRLPDEQDRQLAGKAAALKDDQLDEIARLPKGVAVIYQNNWTEPVLCKINKFEGEEKRYQYKTCATDRKAELMPAILLKNLLKKEKGEPLDLNLRQLQDLLLKISMPSKTKIEALKALQKNGRCRQKDIQSVVYKLVCTPKVEEELTRTESIEEWRDEIAYFGSMELADLDEEMLNEVAELILLEQIKRYDWPKTYLEQWQEFRKKEMLV